MVTDTSMDASADKAGSSPALTDDVVQELNQVIERHAKRFRLEMPVQDVVAEVWHKLLRRSKRLGTSLLERYDPKRATLRVYVSTIALSEMRKLYNKERYRRRMIGAFHNDRLVRSGVQLAVAKCHSVPVLNSRGTLQYAAETEYQLADDSTADSVAGMLVDFDIELLFRALRGTRHDVAKRRNASGEGLSNLQVLRCLLVDRMDVREIAEKFGVSVSEIRRRTLQLRNEPRVQLLRHG